MSDEPAAGGVITFSCPNCDRLLGASPHAPDVPCPSCFRRVSCVECPHCSALLASVALEDLECPECAGLIGVLSGPAPRRTFGGQEIGLSARSNLLRDAWVIDSAGWAPRPRTEVALEVSSSSFGFGPEPYRGPTIWLPLSVLHDVQVNGSPLLEMNGSTTGTRTVSGTGASMGRATDDALEELASSAGKWIVLTLAGDDGFATLRVDDVPVDDIPHQLASMRSSLALRNPSPPVSVPRTADLGSGVTTRPYSAATDAGARPVDRLAVGPGDTGTGSGSSGLGAEAAMPGGHGHGGPWLDVVSALERLTHLHDVGALSEDEFREAKGALIRALGGRS